MATKQIHYSSERIKKENALINLIIGEKSNGKSYQMKHGEEVEHYLQTGMRFILLRRWKEDISNLWIEQYFADVDVSKLTNGKYNCIANYRKTLYFAVYDVETNKTTRFEKIGYVMALSTEQHMSSASFLDVDSIVFEEFMERGSYIPHEADRLMIFYNTVDRKRGTTKLWLVGNTISRVCPYLQDWNLQEVLRNMKQGDIKTIVINNEESEVKMAIEYCKTSGGKTIAIGNAKGMIDKGEWQSNPQPHLPKSLKYYTIIFRIGFLYKGFKFGAKLLVDNESKEKVWFVYPKTREFKNECLIFSDEIKQNKFYFRDIYSCNIKNEKVKKLLDSFRESKIFYSDDLTGTDFKQAIDFTIRR